MVSMGKNVESILDEQALHIEQKCKEEIGLALANYLAFMQKKN